MWVFFCGCCCFCLIFNDRHLASVCSCMRSVCVLMLRHEQGPTLLSLSLCRCVDMLVGVLSCACLCECHVRADLCECHVRACLCECHVRACLCECHDLRLFPDQIRPKMASFRPSSVCTASSQMCKRKLWSRDTSFTRER